MGFLSAILLDRASCVSAFGMAGSCFLPGDIDPEDVDPALEDVNFLAGDIDTEDVDPDLWDVMEAATPLWSAGWNTEIFDLLSSC